MSTSTSANAINERPTIIDDKSPHCIPFILSRLSAHQSSKTQSSKPFILALTAVQGAGKTTLVTALCSTLREKGIPTLVCSIDDLYLRHEDQVKLAEHHKLNPLVQHRGEPGTHDMVLAGKLFADLNEGKETRVPQYNKSLFSGQGDRVPEDKWDIVNQPGEKKIEVVIFEGWCVGFRALSEKEVEKKWKAEGTITLHKNRLEDLLFVNEKLKGYEVLNQAYDALVHIDAAETEWVYEWREEQELRLREEGKGAMSKEEVVRFVDGYFPAYELYNAGLREGFFKSKGEEGKGRQMRLLVGKDRKVREVISI